MAAQDLTAAALLKVQARLEELFAPGQSTPSRYERVDHVGTARAMLANNIARTMPITDAIGKCRGYSAYHLTGAQDTAAYWGTGSGLSLGCDVLSGDGVVATETQYSFNTIGVVNRTVDDDLCGNLFKDPASRVIADEAATIVAENLAFAMQTIRKNLNAKFITFLDGNRTPVNNDGNLPAGVAYSGTTFVVTESGTFTMQNPDTLTDLEAIAINNDMTNWFFVGGRYHFYNATINSQFNVLNDDQRSEVRWGQTPLFFDIKNLDSTLSGKNSFMVDPGSFLFFDHVDADLSEVPLQVSDEYFEFAINDPVLSVLDNGRLRPLRYTVRYQRACNGVNTSRMRVTKDHNFEVILNAGLHVAPPAADTHTGILKFKSAS